MAKHIPLGGSHAKGRTTIVSEEYFDQISGFCSWTCSNGYATGSKNKKLIKLHRFVMELKLGRSLETDEVVDHINMNPLDNRNENLRLATRALNSRNRRIKQGRKYNYTGVEQAPSLSWVALIGWRHGLIRLGGLSDETEAAFCYDFALSIIEPEMDARNNVIITDRQRMTELQTMMKQKILDAGWREDGNHVEPVPKERRSPFHNVSPHGKTSWYAYITYNKKRIELFVVPNALLAAMSFNRANLYLYGPDAKKFHDLSEYEISNEMTNEIDERVVKFLTGLGITEDHAHIPVQDQNPMPEIEEDGSIVIKLSGAQGEGSELITDPEIWPLIAGKKVFLSGKYPHISIGGKKSISFHRLYYESVNGPIPKNKTIDHIDRNALNGRLTNLRAADHSTQMRNRVYMNKTGYTGVFAVKKRWGVAVHYKKKTVYLGSYEHPFQAAYAYNYVVSLIDPAMPTPNRKLPRELKQYRKMIRKKVHSILVNNGLKDVIS